MRTLLLVLVAALVVAPVDAEVRVTNPGFGTKESFEYDQTVGAETRPLSVSLTLVGEGPSSRYEFRSIDADLTSVYRLDPVTLVSLSSETVTRAPDAEVKRTSDYRNLKAKPGADDLVVTDLGSLPAVLRGFPWGKVSSAKVLYVGNSAGSSITFGLQVTGKETVTAAGRSWECWHLTAGVDGPLGMFLAKTEYWFATGASHLLVKSSGPSGGPGSPVKTVVLRSYQITP